MTKEEVETSEKERKVQLGLVPVELTPEQQASRDKEDKREEEEAKVRKERRDKKLARQQAEDAAVTKVQTEAAKVVAAPVRTAESPQPRSGPVDIVPA